MGTVILQIQSSSCQAPHYEDTNYRQKTTTGFPLDSKLTRQFDIV